ncbi:Uncharacterized protein FWK35_00015678, partial [Aphis craccivora]
MKFQFGQKLKEIWILKLKKKCIYLIVIQDRYGLLKNLKKTLGIEPLEKKIETPILSETENSSSEEDCDSMCSNGDQFSLDIPYDVYRKMKLVTMEYSSGNKKRKYCVLEQGVWSNIIYDYFFSAYDFFLTFNAVCKDEACKSNLKGVAEKNPLEGQSLKIIITTKYTRGIPHNYKIKRHLNGRKRIEVGDELQKFISNIWSRNEMRKKCEFGDICPLNIYSGPVLRKIKQEIRNNKLGIEINNPIQSLIKLKHTTPYAGFIHLISADPFMVHYWSPYQMAMYKETLKISKNKLRLCIDATGGLVKKIRRTTQDVTSAHIFLYLVVLHDGIIQVPVCQMLSEIQDIPSITYWLSEWVRAGAPYPSEVVVYHSNAFIGAVTHTFTILTKSQYCEKSLRVLQSNFNDSDLSVYVRLDIAHFIKMICQWKCFKKNGNTKVKDLYVRGIILLTKTQTMEQFAQILMKIVVISTSETDGNIKNTSINTNVEIFRNDLCCLIENDQDYKTKYVEFNEYRENIDEEDYDVKCQSEFLSEIDIFINRIKNKAEDHFTQGDRFWLRKIGPQLISVYKKKFKTNNNIESFHNKLRQTFQTSHPNIWAILSNICKLNLTRNSRSKYLANDLRIITASRQLRQGLITIKMFLLKCSYSVASYEERMRAMELNINEENALNNVFLPEGQGNQNDEELAFEDGPQDMNSENVIYNEADFIIPEDLELAIWDETYGNDEVIEVPYYAHVPKNIDVFSLQNEEEMCIVCRDSPRTHALIPCGHKVMCIDCVPNYNMNGVLFIVQSLQLKKHKKKLYYFTKNMVNRPVVTFHNSQVP